MKLLSKILLSTTILSLLLTPAFAQDTPLSELLEPDSEVKAAEIESLDQKEDERREGFQDQLGFVLPEYTDNASYVITFTDPSPEEEGVQISIDGSNYSGIESPYTFSALAIGNHDIVFKFVDNEGTSQELEYMMTVLPRSPIVKSPQYTNNKLVISGTGLANSEIMLFISSGLDEYTLSADVNSDGDWNVSLNPEEGLENGIYSIVGYARKYGFASEYSKPVVYEIGESTSEQEDKDIPVYFNFTDVTKDNILDLISKNRDLNILLGITFLVGSFLALILHTLISGRRVNRDLKRAEQSIQKVGQTKEKTLRELFEEETEKKPSQEKKTTKKTSKKNKEKVVSKEEFLKDFKSIDPDQKDGKEKKSKKIKDVKVSLTSKEE